MSTGADAARPSLWRRMRWRALRFGARHGVDVVSTVRSGPAAGLCFGSMSASADYSSGRNERWVQEAVAAALRPGSVFVDVSAGDFNIDPASVAATLAALEAEGRLRPRAIIAVDLFGQPADYEALEAIARPRGLALIADAAQSFGGKRGRRSGRDLFRVRFA